MVPRRGFLSPPGSPGGWFLLLFWSIVKARVRSCCCTLKFTNTAAPPITQLQGTPSTKIILRTAPPAVVRRSALLTGQVFYSVPSPLTSARCRYQITFSLGKEGWRFGGREVKQRKHISLCNVSNKLAFWLFSFSVSLAFQTFS